MTDAPRSDDAETAAIAASSQPAGQSCPLVGVEFRAELARLEAQLVAVRADDNTSPAGVEARAERLRALEIDLLVLAHHSPYASVRDVGTILADLDQLRAACHRLELPEHVQRAERISREYVEFSAQAWQNDLQERLRSGNADAHFHELIETTALQLEAGKYQTAGTATSPVFQEIRGELREALLQALDARPASPEQRQEWVTFLVDRADMAVTGVDDDEPASAAMQIRVIADDVDWHLRHVENQRGPNRRKLRHVYKKLQANWQELVLKDRLESRFGARFVRVFDRCILLLILAVISCIVVEAFVTLPPKVTLGIHIFDGLACLVFLTEFFTRLSLVPLKWLWFRRHFLIDFVPSIPVGLLFLWWPAARAADGIRTVLIGRAARILRVARYFRALGLLARGLDRVARQYGTVLNQNVILYPTRDELQRSRETVPNHLTNLRRIREGVRQAWSHLLQVVPISQRAAVAQHQINVLQRLLNDESTRYRATTNPQKVVTREIAAEVLIENLATMTPGDADASLGEELVSQIAKIVRTISWAPLRWLPILSSVVPRLNKSMTDAEITAATARRCGRLFQKFHGLWFWVADLYGTVTPSEFVDRVGSMLIKSSLKPVSRLFLFGGLFLVTNGLLLLVHISFIDSARSFLNRYVGPTLIILGSISIFVLAMGWWMRSVAREATEFYERSAHAQFLALTEVIRSRYLQRDIAILYDRVLRPEWTVYDTPNKFSPSFVSATSSMELPRQHDNALMKPARENRQAHLERISQRVHRSLVEAHLGSADDIGYQGLDTTLLLYRDWLDGAIFTDNDTRSTSQLLGNPAIRQIVYLSHRVQRRDEKELQRLDLVRQKSLFGGPYLWFNFISRSVAHSVASLLVDYNQHAVPLEELPQLGETQRARYERWLQGNTHDSLKTTDTNEAQVEQTYVTTAFTALHFLDFDSQRDAEVEYGFGREVAERLKRDRSFLIRRIFGTFPMHNQPKPRRVVNLYALYGSWLSGGRILLLPVFLFGLFLQIFWAFLCWIAKSLQQIRRPELRRDSADAAESHFQTAVRKIDRIRGPAVYASLRLRLRCDSEYLGVPIPGVPTVSRTIPDLEADLEFLRPRPEILELVSREQERANADMSRLGRLFDEGLLEKLAELRGLPAGAFETVDHRRATAQIYLGDYCGIRKLLSAADILHEVTTKAATEPDRPGKLWPRWKLKRQFQQYWEQHGSGDESVRHSVWRAVLNNVWGAKAALHIWCTRQNEAVEEGERMLAELLLHPRRILDQLLTLRVVQTLAVLDVLDYRQHVYHLGRYAEMGDTAGGLLDWECIEQPV